MLVIRKEQMDVLSEVMRQRFIDRVIAHLQTVFPDKLAERDEADVDQGDERIREQVFRLIEMASQHDIVSERDVARYIDLSIEFGEGFEKDRKMMWAAKILSNPRLSGAARVSLIYEQLPFHEPESRLIES